MARVVEEIMNRELLSLRPSDDVDEALRYLLAMGVSGAPVVDGQGYPLGVVSFRDLLPYQGGTRIMDRMSAPAISIARTASIEAAARLLSERGIHRLVVVDEDGLTVGVVSASDCMRGLCGLPASHPATFPHYDRRKGLTWTDDLILCSENLDLAPSAPGILLLRVGGLGRYETDVWIESTENVRARLQDMLLRPQQDRRLAQLLSRYGKDLRFRASPVPDASRRVAALDALRVTREPWVVIHGPSYG
jgi:hypothetical protein